VSSRSDKAGSRRRRPVTADTSSSVPKDSGIVAVIFSIAPCLDSCLVIVPLVSVRNTPLVCLVSVGECVTGVVNDKASRVGHISLEVLLPIEEVRRSEVPAWKC
jgi:hypothetical protein